jgi:hypothetical protein
LCDLTTGQGTNVNLSSSSKLDVLGALTVTSGSLSSNGAITLKSNSSSTARVAVSTGAISGNITSERYVPNGGWHLTGTVFPSQTISNWNDDIWTQGPMPGANLFNGGYNTSTIFEYDQSNNDPIPYVGGTTNGWIVPTTSNLDQYKGYRVSIPAGKTLDNTGTYTMDPSPISLNFDPTSPYPGWNLVTNPHLSAVNSGGFSWGAGVQQVVVVWNPVTSQYQYTGTLGGLTGVTLNNGITPIASGQAFFVKCTAPSTLTIPQSAKATTSGTFFRTATDGPNALEIRLKNEDSKFDACLLQFVEGSNVDYETSYDAMKLSNPDMNVYTFVNGNKLAINAMPFEGEQVTLNLGYSVRTNGVYGFQFDGLSLLNFTGIVYLKDNYLNTIEEVDQTHTYIFDSQSGTYNDRFELIFSNSISNVDELKNNLKVVVYPNPVLGDSFTVKVEDGSTNMEVKVCDLLGRVISTSNNTTVKSPLVSGQYVIKVKTPKSTYTKHFVVE